MNRVVYALILFFAVVAAFASGLFVGGGQLPTAEVPFVRPLQAGYMVLTPGDQDRYPDLLETVESHGDDLIEKLRTNHVIVVAVWKDGKLSADSIVKVQN